MFKAQATYMSWTKIEKLAYFGRFEKELAAEALRRNENDTQKALDDLTNPETNSALQVICLFSLNFLFELNLDIYH